MSASCLLFGAAGLFCPLEVPPPPPPPPPVTITAEPVTETRPDVHQHDGYPVHDVRTRHEIRKPKPVAPPPPAPAPEPPPAADPPARTASDAVGLAAADIGSDGAFWCTDLVAWLFPDVDLGSDPGPQNARFAFPETKDPVAGDVVLIDLFPGNDLPEHVAIVESLDADTVHVIEGNGKVSTTHVARASYPLTEVFSFHATQETR